MTHRLAILFAFMRQHVENQESPAGFQRSRRFCKGAFRFRYVMQDENTRLRLLIARHIRFGKDPELARDWVLRSDERNAALVATTRARADALVRIAG